jgi:hypothetical protein
MALAPTGAPEHLRYGEFAVRRHSKTSDQRLRDVGNRTVASQKESQNGGQTIYAGFNVRKLFPLQH